MVGRGQEQEDEVREGIKEEILGETAKIKGHLRMVWKPHTEASS